MFDLKLEGATVIDGTGTAGGRADVGIRDETIAAVGDLSREAAGRTLNVAGRAVTPGFIDMHSHSDWRLWANRRAESKIRQGVTTEVVGNCGFSPAPVVTEHLDDLKGFALYLPRNMDFRWRSVREYLDAFDAVAEAIRIGRESDLPVQISHVKAAGRPNWGKVERALGLIDAACADGHDVMADVYPYTASSTTLRALLPDWALEGGVDAMLKRLADAEVRARIRRELELPVTGQSLLDRIGWENIMIAYCARRKDREGRRLSEIAAARGLDPLEAAIELIVEEAGKASMILFQLDEGDLRRALAHPRVMIGSDGSSLAPYGELGEGKPHPRSYGTFPRVLGEYAREQRVLTLAQAVHKMTGLPARRLGLKDRGVI